MWVERLHEDFSSGIGDLLSNPGNGSIVASGGVLTMATPGTLNCDWWISSAQNGPTIYRDFGRYRVSGSGIYMVEIYHDTHDKISGSNESTIIAAIEKDPANYYLMQNYWENSDYWNIGKIISDVWISNWSGDWGSRYRPGWIRLYVNGGKERIWPVERNQSWLNPGSIGMAFSRERDGVGAWADDIWIYSAPELLQGYSSDRLNFRFVKKSYGSQPQTEATFKDLYVYEWVDENRTFEGDGGRVVGAEDAAEVRFSDDGTKKFGMRVPSGAEAPRDIDRVPPIAVGIRDEHGKFGKTATIPQQVMHTYPQLPAGLALNEDDDKTRSFPKTGFRDGGEKDWVQGLPVQFRQDTLDPEAHVHFAGLNPKAIYYYRTAGEEWANPTASNFTGYARDGYHYTNGVLDPGPVQAPWAQEFISGNRSNRDDFPLEALIVITDSEVVIFDLDGWPTYLRMWMRFELGSSSWYMVGRQNAIDCAMANGILAVSLYQGSEVGGLITINFKVDGTTDAANLVRSDGHWYWASGFDIRDRNSSHWTTSGVSPSLRINPEYVYSVDIYDDGQGKAWVAAAGEDNSPHIIGIENNHLMWAATSAGDLGVENNGDTRRVLFDESGWLWFAIENKLYRCMLDYQGGVLIANQRNSRQRGVTLQEATITSLAQGRNFVYAGTNRGVYRIHKATLRANLAYTIAGGGGGGWDNNPPDGEILVGVHPEVLRLHCISVDKSSILQVVTKTQTGRRGGVTTIRLTDDYILGSREYPELPEDAVYAGASTIGV